MHDAERCPCCGRAVRVVSGDEGTSHYEPVPDPELTRLREGRDALLAAIDTHRETLDREALGPRRHDRDQVDNDLYNVAHRLRGGT